MFDAYLRFLAHWWYRRCGGREVFYLAMPLVMSTISWTVMNFIDRTYLMWYSRDAMAAAMPAGTISFTAICLVMGVTAYVGTFVAQYHGADQPEHIPPIVWQGIWIGLCSIPVFLWLRSVAPSLFANMGHTANLQYLETELFQALMFGAGAVAISSAMAGYFSGRGDTVTVMIVSAIAALINMGLDYAWIFGKFGFPQGGIRGAGLATAVSEWSKVVIFFVLMVRDDRRYGYGLFRNFGWNTHLALRLIRFGGPSGLHLFIEIGAFSAYLGLVGQLGPSQLAATSLAFNINSLAFVPLMGLGMAASIMVGNQIGRVRPDLATRATWTTLTIASLYSIIMGLLYFLVPDLFLLLHRQGANSEEFAQVREVTVVLLRYVAAYCLLDAIQVVFSGALKGAGDTRFVLLIAVLLSPCPVLLGWIGIHYWNWDLHAFWYLITGWILAQAIIYGVRFQQGKWKSMRVIES